MALAKCPHCDQSILRLRVEVVQGVTVVSCFECDRVIGVK